MLTSRTTAGLMLVLTCSLGAAGSAPERDSIRKEDMKADLFFLASDAMQGRLTGTPENTVAAEWIKSRFERMGLEPVDPARSFYQPYNLMTATLGKGNALTVSRDERSALQLVSGQDFFPQRFSASGRARGNVVFAGFGIWAPDLGYDDYRGQDPKGKVVLVLDHEPGERDPSSPFDGLVSAEASNALRKTLTAQDKGAAGILFVTDVHNHPAPANFEATARTAWPAEAPRIERFTLADWMERVRIPAAQISPALAAILISGTTRSLDALARAVDTQPGASAIAVPDVQVDLTTSVERHVIPDRNVIGAITGSDPRLKDEWVIVCAHFDHDGADGPRIFNGADDDGSGTVGLIEIAEAYAAALRRGQRPRRSVLFAAWNSEERGLLGAWAYTEHPIEPLEQTVAVLNLDMIGRNEEVQEGGGSRFQGLEIQDAQSNSNAVNVIGTLRSPDLKSEVEKANADIGLDLRLRYDNNSSNLMRRSDHWPFIQRGVPGLWFQTGLHPDYHTVDDRPEKINYEKMEKIARLVHEMSWNLAQQDGRPRLTPRGQKTRSSEQ